MPIIIKAKPGDTTEVVIRKFQKQVAAEGLVQEIRDKEFHKKPAILRQEYLAERRRKIRRAQRYA